MRIAQLKVGPPKASKLRPSKNLSASFASRLIEPTSDRCAADELFHPARRDAEQGREGARLLVDLGFEGWYLRLGGMQQGRRLRRIDVGHRTLAGPAGRDVEALPLQLGVPARHAELLLGGADPDVVRGHLRQQGHEHVVVVGDGGQQLGIRRLDAAAERAPEVELPGDVEAGEELVEAALGGHHDDVLARDRPAVAADGVLGLGEERPDRDPPPCLPLEHPDAGCLERGVLPVGLDDQVGQDRVAERLPPRTDRLGGGSDAARAPGDPVGRDGGLRTPVVGSDHHASAHDEDREDRDARASGTLRFLRARREVVADHRSRAPRQSKIE